MALIKGHNRRALREYGNRAEYADTDNPEPTRDVSHGGQPPADRNTGYCGNANAM